MFLNYINVYIFYLHFKYMKMEKLYISPVYDVPEVTNKCLADLLHAPEVLFTEIPRKVQSVCPSIQGCVKMVMLIMIDV